MSELLRGTIHKPVVVHLCPQMIVRPQYTMVQLIFVKVTVHPTLHMVTTERMEWDTRLGMIWAARAPAGRSGRSRVQRSRAGGHFFLSSDTTKAPNIGAVLNIAHIIKNVMLSATEAELVGLYIMAREAVYIRIILEELGHNKQPPMPLLTDNAMADAVINGKVQPKRSKAMDMRFHWL